MLLLAPGKRGRITLHGRGDNLALPSLPIGAGSLVAQLRRDHDASRFWESVFPQSATDTPRLFRAALP